VCSGQISITTSVTLVGVASSADVDGFDGQSTTALFSVTGSGVQVNFQFLQLKNAKVRNCLFPNTPLQEKLANVSVGTVKEAVLLRCMSEPFWNGFPAGLT
jgi:hypothetical protein